MAWKSARLKSNLECLGLNEKYFEKFQSFNKRHLIENVINVWNNKMTEEYLEKIVTSMPKRLQMVIVNKGDVIKY